MRALKFEPSLYAIAVHALDKSLPCVHQHLRTPFPYSCVKAFARMPATQRPATSTTEIANVHGLLIARLANRASLATASLMINGKVVLKRDVERTMSATGEPVRVAPASGAKVRLAPTIATSGAVIRLEWVGLVMVDLLQTDMGSATVACNWTDAASTGRGL